MQAFALPGNSASKADRGENRENDQDRFLGPKKHAPKTSGRPSMQSLSGLFDKILELDDNSDDREFSQAIVTDFFVQFETTIQEIDAAM